MVVHIDKGWLWFSNLGVDYLKVYAEHIFWTPVFLPEVEHYEGGVNIGYDLGKFFLVIKATKVWLESTTEHDNFVSYIKSWQQANTLQVEIIKNSSNDKEKLDGTHTVYPVLITKGLSKIEKMSGDQEKYCINNISMEQRGSAS